MHLRIQSLWNFSIEMTEAVIKAVLYWKSRCEPFPENNAQIKNFNYIILYCNMLLLYLTNSKIVITVETVTRSEHKCCWRCLTELRWCNYITSKLHTCAQVVQWSIQYVKKGPYFRQSNCPNKKGGRQVQEMSHMVASQQNTNLRKTANNSKSSQNPY